MDRSINKRNYSHDDLLEQLKAYDRLSRKDKDVLESALRVFFAIFDKDPVEYQFDFRFHRR